MKNDKMLEVVCEEIDKIAEKGLTTGNLDTAYKLIDMYKDLRTVEGMDDYYVDEIICDNSNPEIVETRLVMALLEHKVQMSRFESNSAGEN